MTRYCPVCHGSNVRSCEACNGTGLLPTRSDFDAVFSDLAAVFDDFPRVSTLPPPPAPRPRESDVQRALLAQLNALPRVHVDRVNVALARGPSRVFRTAPIGFPDLIGAAAGRAIAIECKSATGRQRPEQRRWQQRFESAGGIYLIARDVADTVARVRELLR